MAHTHTVSFSYFIACISLIADFQVVGAFPSSNTTAVSGIDNLLVYSSPVKKTAFAKWPRDDDNVQPKAVSGLDSLVAVQGIFRHGERNPLYSYPNDHIPTTAYSVRGKGQLTQAGKRSSYNLGRYLRKKYSGWLSPNFSFDELYVLSSQKDRTVMTALAVTAGLFPPMRADPNSHMNYPDVLYQPIPVYSVFGIIDNIIGQARNCPLFNTLYTNYLETLSAFDAQNKPVYETLTRLTGRNVTFFEDVYEIFDTIQMQQFQGLPKPSWLNDSLYTQMERIGRLEFTAFFATKDLLRLKVGPLFYRMIQNFYLAINQPNIDTDHKTLQSEEDSERYHPLKQGSTVPPLINLLDGVRKAKMYLFSGHDTTISPVLIALNLYDEKEPPPFNSILLFELYQTGNDQYCVQLLYRCGVTTPAKLLAIPACDSKTCCPLDRFEAIVAPVMINASDWIETCGITQPCI